VGGGQGSAALSASVAAWDHSLTPTRTRTRARSAWSRAAGGSARQFRGSALGADRPGTAPEPRCSTLSTVGCVSGTAATPPRCRTATSHGQRDIYSAMSRRAVQVQRGARPGLGFHGAGNSAAPSGLLRSGQRQRCSAAWTDPAERVMPSAASAARTPGPSGRPRSAAGGPGG